MKLFASTDHDGHWPVGVASVVVASSEGQARNLLIDALRKAGLRADDPFTLRNISLDAPAAIILNDGNY